MCLLLFHFVLCIFFFCSILYYASFSVRFCIMYLFLSHIVLCIFFCSIILLCTFFRSMMHYVPFCFMLRHASCSARHCTMYLFLFHVVLCIFFCSMLCYVPFSVPCCTIFYCSPLISSRGAGIACWSERRTRCEFEFRQDGGRVFFSRINFVYWLLLGVRSNPLLPQCT